MKITNKLIDDLSSLAKLSFDEKSKESIKKDMMKMIGFIDKLSEIDTEKIKPLTYLSDELNVFRDDKIENIISNEDALKNAPKKDSDYFKVPKVLKK